MVTSASEEWATDSPKNYQVWFHRRWVVEKLFEKNLLLSQDEVVLALSCFSATVLL